MKICQFLKEPKRIFIELFNTKQNSSFLQSFPEFGFHCQKHFCRWMAALVARDGWHQCVPADKRGALTEVWGGGWEHKDASSREVAGSGVLRRSCVLWMSNCG